MQLVLIKKMSKINEIGLTYLRYSDILKYIRT